MQRCKKLVTLLCIFLSALQANSQQSDSTAAQPSAEETSASKQGATITLQFNDNDSMHVVNATVVDSVTGQPLKEVALTFYVKRSFGLMQVGEATTDSTGFATAEFKKDVRSDVEGKVLFIAKIEDNDVVNNTRVQTILKPDAPYAKSVMPERAMFARHAPWWLVITFTSLLGVVWGIFAYIVYLIKKIRNAGIIHSSTKPV